MAESYEEVTWKLDEDERAQRDDMQLLFGSMVNTINGLRDKKQAMLNQIVQYEQQIAELEADANHRVTRLLTRLARTRLKDVTRIQPHLKNDKDGNLVVRLSPEKSEPAPKEETK